jgi:hypothetical protein
MKNAWILALVVAIGIGATAPGFADCSLEDAQKKLTHLTQGIAKLTQENKIPSEKVPEVWTKMNAAGHELGQGNRAKACQMYDAIGKEYGVK